MSRIIGELAIVAYKARDLPNREIAGKQDPFVLFRLGENTRQTRTDYRGGQHPLWDDQINMPVPEKKKQMLVQVYDEDAKRKDLISELDLDLTKVLEEGEHDGWFPLHFKNRKSGEIYLEMTFYSAAPPPKRQPTRYGAKPKKQAGYAPSVPSVTPQHYPHPPTSAQSVNTRPLPPAPSGAQPTYYPNQYPYTHTVPYPPAVPAHNAPVALQYPVTSRPASYAGPQISMNHLNEPNSPPVPTHISSSGIHHPVTSRPASYAGPQTSVSHLNRPNPPPVPTPNTHPYLAANTSHAPLLSSPYNPGGNPNQVPPSRPNYAPRPSEGYSSYPNNRHSHPQQTNHSYHPPSNTQFQGHPDSNNRYSLQQTDASGIPFAIHQGGYYPPNAGNYAPRPYPPYNTGYPQQQRPNNGHPHY